MSEITWRIEKSALLVKKEEEFYEKYTNTHTRTHYKRQIFKQSSIKFVFFLFHLSFFVLKILFWFSFNINKEIF